jgi:hypothetical protein
MVSQETTFNRVVNVTAEHHDFVDMRFFIMVVHKGVDFLSSTRIH